MVWCEDNGVDFVFGLARNARLQNRIARQMRRSRSRSAKSGKAPRRYSDFRWRKVDSWSRRMRRVVAVTAGRQPRKR